MKTGIVTGSVWATKKTANLTGQIFLRVQCGEDTVVAADLVGAGFDEWVLLCFGSSARMAAGDVPVDAAIVGIIDEQEDHHGHQ